MESGKWMSLFTESQRPRLEEGCTFVVSTWRLEKYAMSIFFFRSTTSNYACFKNYFFERHKHGEINGSPVGSVSKCPKQAELGQPKAGISQLDPDLPCGSTTCCPPGCLIAGSWKGEYNWDQTPHTLEWNVGIPGRVLTVAPNASPNVSCF